MTLSLLAGIFCAVVLRGATATDRLIENLEQHYNRARTLSVDFEENYSLQGHQRPLETGRLTLRKQGKMRWDYSKPAGKVFVSDGKTIYLYTASDNRVEKVRLKDTEDMRAPLAFLLGHLDIRKEFRNIASSSEGDFQRLNARSNSDRTPYGEIEMLVAQNGEIRMLKILGRDGSVLNFTLSQERVNPAVDDGLFRFSIPPGAEVVNTVEYWRQDQ